MLGEVKGQSKHSLLYKALDSTNGKAVVIKRIKRPHSLSTNEMKLKLEAYSTELNFILKLRHDNVVKLKEVQLTANGEIDLIQDIPFGFSMKNHLSNFHKFEESLVKRYTYEVLKGLKYLHDKQIIHRNLKCSNILMNGQGLIMISDYGP